MRLIFMGTAAFAVPSLETLARGPHDVGAVITQPDRPGGRGQRLQSSPVRKAAASLSLEVLQPESLASEAFRRWTLDRGCDLLVVVAYGKLIPPWLIHHPAHGVVNLHASLLPRYRGAAPVNWAIAMGETRTGVCTMQIDEGLDTGPVFACRETGIGPEESAPDVLDRLAAIGSSLLAGTVQDIAGGRARARPQEGDPSLAPLLRREHGYVRWDESAKAIHDKIRAFLPWPGVAVGFRGKRCRLIESRVCETAEGSRELGGLSVLKGGLVVQCGDSRSLEIRKLQLENRGVMSGAELVNGFQPRPGECFTSLAARSAGNESPDRSRGQLQ